MKMKELEELVIEISKDGPMEFDEFVEYLDKCSGIGFKDKRLQKLYDIFCIERDKGYRKEKNDLFMYYHLGE